MGWKTVKEYYGIVHQVQVTEAGICIGSPYIHNIIVISRAGEIIKENDRTLNDDLMRYQREMKADLGKLKELVTMPDAFDTSVPVYTYDGASIIEKQCAEPGWPNVTHDGLMMYENTFSTDRAKVVEWAKRNCLAKIDNTRRYITEQEEQLASLQARLSQAESEAKALGIIPTPAASLEARWFPIDEADRTINHVTEFTQIGLTLKNSDTFWVRDEDGRVYRAAWSEGNNGRDYWWDWEAESPVDPVEFMPHPLDPRFATTEAK